MISSADFAPALDFSGTSWDKARRFGSSHQAGVNAVFADGSVRSISYTIDPTTFSYLGNKSDGQAVNLDDF